MLKPLSIPLAAILGLSTGLTLSTLGRADAKPGVGGGEVGRYQLVSGAYRSMTRTQTLPSVQGLFRCDTMTGKVEQLIERSDGGRVERGWLEVEQ